MLSEIIKINFNSGISNYMHLDLNSCFATIEQQANSLLRGMPIAVAAYTTPRGCILAPSIEAKRFGVKVGMRVADGKKICPDLIILAPDPSKYRFVNQALFNLLNKYTPDITIKSIDEMLLKFDQSYLTAGDAEDYTGGTNKKILNKRINRICAGLTKEGLCHYGQRCVTTRRIEIQANSIYERNCMGLPSDRTRNEKLLKIAQEIKSKIKQEIGEWLTVSVGISTNPYLAKLAAGLHKPDGLDEINQENILQVLSKLKLTDLPYIKQASMWRLLNVNVKNPLDFYSASLQQLKAAFQSINAYYWQLRLHGYEVDNVTSTRKTLGHSYALPKPTNNIKEILNLICKLVEKTGKKLRNNNFSAQGIHLALYFSDKTFWHHGQKISLQIYTNSDLYKSFKKLLTGIPNLKPVSNIFVTCFNLNKDLYNQLNFFTDETKKRDLTTALDKINNKWGDFTVYPANMLSVGDKIVDRIAFGKTWDDKPLNINSQTEFSREVYVS